MIRFDRVTVTLPDMDHPVLDDVSLALREADLVLVIGPSGAGKSTLLQTISGHVPHGTGGRVAGTVTVHGRDTRDHPPRELADLVGVVGQDPLAGFVTDVVEDELAYVMEQLGTPPDVMRRRVEETLDLLGIVGLRDRPLADLSGGEQQRVAIGAALTAHPQVLLLDEPTSALDPTAAEEVLATLSRLVHDLGITVVLAEHRLERVVPFADLLLHVPGDGTVTAGPVPEVLDAATVAPPVVRLGRLLDWSPLPLTVRDARRRASADARLRALPPPPEQDAVGTVPLLSARDVAVRHGPVDAVRGVDVDLPGGTVTAVMGRNGSGKSSLLWALQGSGPRSSGDVIVRGRSGEVDPGDLDPAEARRHVALVPQTPSDLLYLPTVGAESAQADRESGVAPGTCRRRLDELLPGIDDATHPRDLSEGQRLALVLAVQLTADPPVVLLDEPTRGLDEHAKRALADALRALVARGSAVLVATHDVEFVATVADRALVLADGEVVAEGSAGAVVRSSPAFAPQVTKVLRGDWLTVDDVAASLTRGVVT